MDPVRVRLEFVRIENDFRILLPEPIDIAGRFLARRIDWIALKNRPHGQAVVIGGSDMYWRISTVRQGDFERSNGSIVPGFGYLLGSAQARTGNK
jgi:hypothetical protein